MKREREVYRNRIELLQGTLDMLILQTLQWGAQHGYGITPGAAHAIRRSAAGGDRVAVSGAAPDGAAEVDRRGVAGRRSRTSGRASTGSRQRGGGSWRTTGPGGTRWWRRSLRFWKRRAEERRDEPVARLRDEEAGAGRGDRIAPADGDCGSCRARRNSRASSSRSGA